MLHFSVLIIYHVRLYQLLKKTVTLLNKLSNNSMQYAIADTTILK